MGSDHLDNIRCTLGLSITELANLLAVSRRSVHDWLTGGCAPESGRMEVVLVLSQVADAFHEAGISRADFLIRMKAFAGRSLLDLIQAGKYQVGHLEILIQEAKLMKAARERSGLDASKARPTEDWRSYISIPGSFES